MSRRNIWIPDELWARIQLAAVQAGVAEGKPVPVAEWVRRALTDAATVSKAGSGSSTGGGE